MNPINGTSGNDLLTGSAGDDAVDGLGGFDRFETAGTSAGMHVSLDANGRWILNGAQDSDYLANIEQIDLSAETLWLGRNEFRVNTTVTDSQIAPTVAALRGGGWVIAWISYLQDGDGWGVYAQRYDRSGAPVGAETLVNTSTAGQQGNVAVEALADGGYVAVWRNWVTEGGISSQRFDSAGLPVGGELRVNSASGTYQQGLPAVAVHPDGGWVVTWTSHMQDGSGDGVYLQHFDSAGMPVGPETRVNTTTVNHQSQADLTCLHDGSWVVIWTSWGGQDGSGAGIYAQRYDSSGIPVGGETRINATTEGDQFAPCVATLTNGDYLVAWGSSGLGGAGPGIYTQRYDGAGVPVGSEVRIDATEVSLYRGSYALAALADGGYAVTWSQYPDEGGSGAVYVQQYDHNGTLVEGPLLLSTTTTGDQGDTAIAGLPDGGWIGTWDSNLLEGSIGSTDVFARHVAGDGVAGGRFNGQDSGVNTLNGGAVLIFSAPGDNTALFSGNQSVELQGRSGDDTLQGGAGNDLLWGGSGDDAIYGGAGLDLAALVGAASNYTLSFSGDNLMVADKTAADGTDTLLGVESLQFADKTVHVDAASHGSYADLPVELYHFFIVAFNGAPGVTYMDQLAEAYRYGLSVPQIVEIFTTKHQFTDVYPTSLSHHDLAVELTNQIIKNSATSDAKAEAANDIQAALDIGWSVGQVIYTVFGNLAHMPLDDAKWGGTTRQFNNEIAVAKVYTEVLNQSTTELDTLRDVLAPVDAFTDVSSQSVIVTLIGQALLQG